MSEIKDKLITAENLKNAYDDNKRGITELKGDLSAFKDNVVQYDLSSIARQKGTLNSTVADTETNTIRTIDASNNRAVLGPLKFKQSVEIYCDSSIKWKLYKRFSTDGVPSFRDMSGSWVTSKQIEGANEATKDVCNYYFLLAYADDSNIADVNELVSRLHIDYTDENYLGFVEAQGTVYGTGKPIGVGGSATMLRLISYKQKYECDAVFSLSNPNIRVAPIWGIDVYQSANSSTFRYGAYKLNKENENVMMLQDYTGESAHALEFKGHSSFKTLYETLGINVEELIADNKNISGNQLSDANQIVSASNYGNTLLSNIFADGVHLNDGGNIKFAHAPSVVIKDGFAYVAFQCDRSVAQESASTTEIELAKVNLSDYSVEYFTLAKQGTYGGVTFDGRSSNPYACLVGNIVYILFSGTVSGVQTLCCVKFDTSTDTFTISVCNFVFDGTSYVFNTTNFDRFIGGKYGIPSLNYEIVVCSPTESGGVYYITVSSGAVGQMKTPIFSSSDLLNWEIYDVLSYEYGADCESVIVAKNGLFHIASRHSYEDCTTRLTLYDIASKTILETIQIGSTASRPTIFNNNGTLVVSIPLTGRRTMQMMQFLDNHIGTGRLLATMYYWMGLGYNSIVQDDSNLYFAIQTYRLNGGMSSAQNIWFGKSTAIDN